MKIKHVKTWKLNELPEDTKQKAIEKLYDINIEFGDWWDQIYEDAADVGIKITSFNIDRGSCCEGVIYDFVETAQKIIKNHGELCETYLTANNYLEDRAKLVEKYSDGIETDIVTEDNEYDFDLECDDLDEEFKKSILEDYRIILSKNYEYLTSKEAIIETIEANDYDFDVNGNIF